MSSDERLARLQAVVGKAALASSPGDALAELARAHEVAVQSYLARRVVNDPYAGLVDDQDLQPTSAARGGGGKTAVGARGEPKASPEQRERQNTVPVLGSLGTQTALEKRGSEPASTEPQSMAPAPPDKEKLASAFLARGGAGKVLGASGRPGSAGMRSAGATKGTSSPPTAALKDAQAFSERIVGFGLHGEVSGLLDRLDQLPEPMRALIVQGLRNATSRAEVEDILAQTESLIS